MPNKTMTPQELNADIAIRRGWSFEIEDDGSRWLTSPDGNFQYDFPDYCNDIAAAMRDLFFDLPQPKLAHIAGNIRVTWEINARMQRDEVWVMERVFDDILPDSTPIADACRAIAKAWYQCNSGFAVELKETS